MSPSRPVPPPPVALTVAGHDPLGGSGIAADLTTFAAMGCHGTAALTAVTAQHLDSVDHLDWVAADLVAAQLDGIADEMAVAGMKTGLLGSAEVVDEVAGRVAAGALPAPVVDPVLVDGRGRRIVSDTLEGAYRDALFPVAAVLTPNLAEASALVGRPLGDLADVESAAPRLARLGAALVVVTGGALGDRSTDVIVDPDGRVTRVVTEPVATVNVRGSGCTLSAAIAARLAHGSDPARAVESASAFVRERLADSAGWEFRHADRVGPVAHRLPG